MTRSRARWSDESGAELIEFALSLPLLLLIGLGIFDFGLLFQRYEVVTNAAREGARIAVLPGYGDADVVGRVNLYFTVAGLTGTHDAPIVDRATITINGNCVGVTTVTASYPHTFSFVGGIAGYFGGPGLTGGALRAVAQMRNEVPASGCVAP